jgi:lipopolysaccharide biosynthesis regulator YciM
MPWWSRVFGGAPNAPTDVDEALRLSLLAVLDREFEEAERLLDAAVKLDSSRVEPYIALARFYRMRGEIGRAIRVHQNVLLRKDLSAEGRTEAMADLAADFRRGGFLQRAIAAYEDVLAREPRHRPSLEALVSLCSDVRDYDRAIEASKRLSKLVGKAEAGFAREGILRVERARALRAQGRLEEARKAMKRALRKEPTAIDGWLALGELEFEAEHFGPAIDAWSKVPEIDRRRGRDVYPRLERAYAELSRAPDFVSQLRRWLEQRPDDGSARLALGTALAASGEVEPALDELRGALERDRDNVELHIAFGRLLLSEGREAEAAKAHAQLLETLEQRGVPRGTRSLV